MNVRVVAVLVLVGALSGCSPRPRAPALMQGEAVYINAQEGFRFLPPPNWTMMHRSEVPSGPLSEERALVVYSRIADGLEAALEVSMVDVPESEEMAAIVRGRRGSSEWKPEGSVETLGVGGQSAARGAFRASKPGEAARLKEVVAVRRGKRVYFFTGVFAADDDKAREQIRKSIETLTW
jgi:hypothetical protein